MKTTLIVLALLLAAASPAFAEAPAAPQEFGVSFGVFYSSLDRYGEWIQLEPDYYVWRPMRTARSWRPYFYGEWAWTPDGWYWVSDEPWAWAVYHYGRWYYDDYYGWVWAPGYDWAPAWVEWRYSGDYIGWAPLGPYAVFGVGFGIHYYHSWVTPNSYWCFVGTRYMGGPRVYRHIYDGRYNHRYLGVTRSLDGVRYERDRIINRGPDRSFIEQRGGGRIRESRIVDVRDRAEQRVVRRGDQNEIRAYRPRAGERVPGSEVERPGRVRDAERKPALDLRSTDLERRGGERQGRQAEDMRVAPRAATPDVRTREQRPTPWSGQPEGRREAPPRQQPERVAPRERPRVQPAPEARPREMQQAPRNVQPDVRRDVQPRREERVQMPQRQFEPRMTQRERPAQAQPTLRPQQDRGAERAVRRAEPQRVQRPQQQEGRKAEDRRERRGR